VSLPLSLEPATTCYYCTSTYVVVQW